MKHLTLPGKKRIMLLIIPVIALTTYIGYGQYDSWQTKQKFASIEQDIDTLKAELEKQGIGDISKNKYCLRDGEKFGGGQLRCEINIGLYVVKEEMTKIINPNHFKVVSPTDSTRVQYEHLNTKTSCFLIVDKPDNTTVPSEFYCIDAVNKPIYPVNE